MLDGEGEIRSQPARPFMCGICEGFYGKPWTLAQRLVLFKRMQRFGMNTYLYAPKDDYKHRLDWRDLYTEEEACELKQLINAADECHVKFVYALSPGLDMMYSSTKDVDALKAKLNQVKSLGCKRFSLLFDDIDSELCAEDKVLYSSPGDAQSCLTNTIYDYLEQPDIFLFCPTEYSTNRTEPDLASSAYLKTIGESLHSKIDILWTGPKVVSQLITVEHIEAVSRAVKRSLTIWDNIHANDYDQTRLYLGPYSGRDSALTTKLRGVLTNPNCEFEVNFIAMHTLAQWSCNKSTRFIQQDHANDSVTSSSARMDVDTETAHPFDKDGSPSTLDDMDGDNAKGVSQYNEKRALWMAVMDWIPELYKTKTSSGRLVLPADHKTSDVNRSNYEASKNLSAGCESMSQSDVSTCGTDAAVSKSSCPARSFEEHNDLLTVDDVLLICHLFYLPYEHGPCANLLLQSACWLLSHSPFPLSQLDTASSCNSLSSDEDDEMAYEWYHRAGQFHRLYRDIATVVDKLVNITNREILYEVYTYVTGMRSTIALLNSYIKWIGTEKKTKDCKFKSGDQEPWVYQFGLLGELRNLLPITPKPNISPVVTQTLMPQGPFIVRPFYSTDKADVYAVCEKVYGSVQSPSCLHYPQLLADWYVGGLLDCPAVQCYVLENNDSLICGYAMSCLDVKQYSTRLIESWIPTLRTRYPRSDVDNNQKDILNLVHDSTPSIPEEITSIYPSVMMVGILPTFSSVSAVEALVRCAYRSLEAQQSKGVHVSLPPGSDIDMLLSHALSFSKITSLWSDFTENYRGWKIIGKQFEASH